MRAPGWVATVLAWPVVARHSEALRRANGLRFTRWAAAIAMFAYLSLFPLATLVFVVLSRVLEQAPGLREDVQKTISDALPGILGTSGDVPVDLTQTAVAATSAGIVGVVALLLAGLGWVDATIEGVRRMLGVMRRRRNIVLLRLEDTLILVVLGSVLLAALVASVGARACGQWVVQRVNVRWLDGLISHRFSDGVVILLVTVTVASLYAFAWRRSDRSWRAVLLAAFLVGVAVELMSLFAYLIVGPTLNNPVYGTLAVAAALLLFLYFGASIVLYGASWVAVCESRPRTSEEVAYSTRMSSGSDPLLP